MTRGQSLDEGAFVPQLAVRYSGYQDKVDVDHHNVSLLLSLSAQLSDELNLSATLPYHFLQMDGSAGRRPSREDGLGDLTLTGSWSPWPGEADPRDFWDYRRLSFIAGVKLPTGDSDLDRFAGAAGEIVPLGTGTTDLLLGVSYSAPLADSLRLFDTLLGSIPLRKDDREPPPGTVLGSKSAPSVFDRIGAFYSFSGTVAAYGAFDFLWKARAQGSAVSEDAGGFFVWFSPGVVLRGPAGTLIDLTGQIPLGRGNPSVTLSFSVNF